MSDLRHTALRWLIQGFPGSGYREWAQSALMGTTSPPPRRITVRGVEIDAADPEIHLSHYARARSAPQQRAAVALEALDFGRAHLAYKLAEALFKGSERDIRLTIAAILNALGSLSHYVAELVEEGGDRAREEVLV